jgi:hypothetical protein
MKRNPEEHGVQKDIHAPVQLSQPVVAPGITDPVALKYAKAAAQRRPQQSRYAAPVAGGPSPSIPRLDAPAAKGMSMADQAAMHRAVEEGPAQGPAMPKGGLFQGPAPRSMPSPAMPVRQGPNILPNDILPDEAMQDPDFKQGQGSRYAASQPAMAMKYGVIRGTQRIAPQQLATPNKGLSDKTLEGLKALQDAQTLRGKAESSDARIEREAAGSPAGAAGRLGNAPNDGPQIKPQLSEKEAVEIANKMDDFDFNTLREMMMKDILNNDAQRKIIEARCEPLDISDMLVSGFVTQRVPIIPGKFEPTFASGRGDEDLAIKRLIMLESKSIEVAEKYLLDKYSLMGTTIGLQAINGMPYPSHLDQFGKFNEELFWVKFGKVSKLPFHMLSSLGVNYYWFDIRVRKLFVAEAMGNG